MSSASGGGPGYPTTDRTRVGVVERERWKGLFGAHDPTVVRGQDGTFAMFSTDTAFGESPGSGGQVRVSDDLVSWRWAGHALDGVPASAREWTGAQGIWAPEVVRRGTELRMYYSASTFGSNTSVIGLATAPDVTGPWQDRGPVVATRTSGDPQNAIDAAVVGDRDGSDWLLYGSFFAGIHLLALDHDGFPRTPGAKGVAIARRPSSVEGAVEGAHMLYHPEFDQYFLFFSNDSLFSTYNIRVARAPAVDGPFVDARGRATLDVHADTDSGGTKILGSHAFDDEEWLAPGHSSHLEVDGRHFLVHHVRLGSEPAHHVAQVRQLAWTSRGWPVVSPIPYAGGQVGGVRVEELRGKWSAVRLEDETTSTVPARAMSADGAQLLGPTHSGRTRLSLEGHRVDGVVFTEPDERGQSRVAFSGLDELGRAVLAVHD